jgi:hypothetical protein
MYSIIYHELLPSIFIKRVPDINFDEAVKSEFND